MILADRMVISKTDLADSETVERLRERCTTSIRAPRSTRGEGRHRSALSDRDRSTTSPAIEPPHAGFVAEAEHSDGIVSFVMDATRRRSNGRCSARDGNADRAARPRPAARQRAFSMSPAAAVRCWCRSVQHLAIRRWSLRLAGQRSHQPRGVHHPRHQRAAGATDLFAAVPRPGSAEGSPAN